jgi:hypothetical protein
VVCRRSRGWCVDGVFRGRARIGAMRRRRRLRRLVPDSELIRRRAAGESLRELESDYGLVHTTLGDYFQRPEVMQELREAARQLRLAERAVAERRAGARRLEQEVPRKAKEPVAYKQQTLPTK